MKMRFFMHIILLLFTSVYAQQAAPGKALSLDDAINTALRNNPEIKSSQERINAASGRLWSGVSLPAPEFSLNYEYIPSGQTLNNFGERSYGITQSIEFPINYFLRRSKFSDERRIAENEFSQTQLSVITKVKLAYYNSLSKQEELKLAEENLFIAEDFYKKAEIRFNAGEATHLERLTANVQYTEAKNTINIRQSELKSVLADLKFAMGYGKDAMEEVYLLTDSLRYNPLNFSLENLFKTSEYSNSRIIIHELKLSTSSTERTLAWTNLFPSFSISYFNQARDGLKGFYGASLGVTVPLWFIFDQKGKIQEAEANKQIAESELKNARNEFYLKIEKAYSDYQIADKQVRLYESDILPQSEEIYRTASKSYEAGEITYVEYLQAKQTVISSRSNYINTLLSYNKAIVLLEEAAGKSLK